MIEEKPWYNSKTIWGSLVAVASSLLSMAGIEVAPINHAEIADSLVQLIGAAGALFAVYGRLSATEIIS